MNTKCDFLVIGGGVIGVNLAIEARRRFPDATVTVLEKEADCGLHASGRNSGVLHAGFYYTADSLKARLTRDGNRQMTEYCEERGLGINRCGKLVIAKNDAELPVLDELLSRARHNGVELYEVSEQEAGEIEPLARFHKRALFSPSTATVDPRAVMQAFVADAGRAGIRAQLLDTRARKLEMDFKMEGDERSFHVLNAVSPAFTCARPFSEYTLQQIEKALG